MQKRHCIVHLLAGLFILFANELSLSRPVPVHAQEPKCYDPITKKEIPCPPTPESQSGDQGGGGQPEKNGRICVSAFNDLNFTGVQDPGEPLLSGGRVEITNLSTGAVTIADLLPDGPNCQFLPGDADYSGRETPPPGFSTTGPDSFGGHLDANGTINVVFANSAGKPSPIAPQFVKPTATQTSTHTSTPTESPATTPTNMATATSTPTATPTAASNVVGITDGAGPEGQPTQPPAPRQPSPSRTPACPPWLIASALGLLTAFGSVIAFIVNRNSYFASYATANFMSIAPGDEANGTVAREYGHAPNDGFGYDHSGSQQRIINTAFGQGGPRPNDRLVSAGRGISILFSLAAIGVGGLLVGAGLIGAMGGLRCSGWPWATGAGVAAGVGLGLMAALGSYWSQLRESARQIAHNQQSGTRQATNSAFNGFRFLDETGEKAKLAAQGEIDHGEEIGGQGIDGSGVGVGVGQEAFTVNTNFEYDNDMWSESGSGESSGGGEGGTASGHFGQAQDHVRSALREIRRGKKPEEPDKDDGDDSDDKD